MTEFIFSSENTVNTVGRNGMTVTLGPASATDLGNGYTRYQFSYTETNLTSEKIDQGSLKLFFSDGSVEKQYGFFNTVLPGEDFSTTRTHNWDVLSTKSLSTIQYDHDHFFDNDPIDGSLQWKVQDNLISLYVDIAPVFSSGANASLAENSAITTSIYNAEATDDGGVVDAGINYSLSGADASAFDIVAETGVVTLKEAADYEAKKSYLIDIIASDSSNNTTTQAVTVTVTDVYETLYGFEDNDILDGFSGYDVIDGKEGFDTAKYSVASTEVSFSENEAGQLFIQNSANSSESDTIVSMERIQFSDKVYALDLDGNTGIAAKAIIATFGADKLSTYMKPALNIVDGGTTLDELCDLVISGGYIESSAGGSDMSSFVEYVYGNVVGRELNALEQAIMTTVSTGGSTKAELLKLAVQTDDVASQITTNAIDLIGVAGSADGEILALQYDIGLG